MANATLTLKIAGTVNGKTIAYTGTQEVDNIDTVIQRLGATSTMASLFTHGSTTQTPIAEQDHDILLVANNDTRATLSVVFTLTAGSVSLFLEPGAFFIVQKAAAGGVMNLSTTATTTTSQSTTSIEIGKPTAYNGAAKSQVFGCYNYAS